MTFPFTGVKAIGWVLPILGFTAGASSGFWGVGGGWIITPALFILGFPMNVAVGTSLSFIFSQAIVSGLKHREMGNVNMGISFLLLLTMLPSLKLGVISVEWLKKIGKVDRFLGIFYIFYLFVIFLLIFIESLRAKKLNLEDTQVKKNLFPIPPYITIQDRKVSLWAPLLTGILSGYFAGILGIGGGTINFPLMIYVVGLPTKIAVGTSLFTIILLGAYGTFAHAYTGNVDLLAGWLLLLGGVIGARIGALAVRHTTGTNIRLLFSIGVGITGLAMIFRMVGLPWISFALIMGIATLIVGIIIYFIIQGKLNERRSEKLG